MHQVLMQMQMQHTCNNQNIKTPPNPIWLYLSIRVLAGKAEAARIIVDSSTRSIQAQHTQRQTKQRNANIQHSQENLLW